MKYLLIPCLILLLSSCQKKHCWKCQLSQNEPASGWDTSYTIAPVCDKTKKEIRQYESDVYSLNATRNGIDPVHQALDCEQD